MRKITIGALSVAGLLATVLALASSPATSQTVVVFNTGAEPGTYTVSWSTRGGCDPSRPGGDTTVATDGATGSRTATVAPPASANAATAVGAGGGTPVEFSVAVNTEACTYDWTGTFTSNLPSHDGIRCVVGISTPSVGPSVPSGNLGNATLPSTAETNTLAVGTTCNTVAQIKVTVNRPIDNDGDPDQPHSGAILNTVFTVGATQHTANNAPTNDECVTVTGETEVNDPTPATAESNSTDDDTVEAVLTVVQTPLSATGGFECTYNVGVVVPAGFEATGRNSEGGRVSSYTLTPALKANEAGDAVDVATTVADCGVEVATETGADPNTTAVNGDRCITARLEVSTRMMYILQNVVGDSGGANARYSLTEDKECAIPHDLPKNLEAEEVGGIQTTKRVTVVELREGFFNISAAVMGHDPENNVDTAGRTYAPRFALNADGEACSFTAAVSNLPDGCDAAEDSITVNAVTGADSHGRVITTFDIGCDGDDGDDDMGDDMDDMDDGAAGDMGDMDDGASDDMDMGPPADEPTG